MPTCANCGAYAEGQFCPSCGAPIGGDVGAGGQQPPAQPMQQPAYGQPPPAYGQPPPGAYPPQAAYQPGAYPPPYAYPREASAAYWLGVLSIVFAFLFQLLGIIFGVLAIYLGKQGQKEGLLKADQAVTFGMIGLIISIVFYLIVFIFIGAMFAFL